MFLVDDDVVATAAAYARILSTEKYLPENRTFYYHHNRAHTVSHIAAIWKQS